MQQSMQAVIVKGDIGLDWTGLVMDESSSNYYNESTVNDVQMLLH